jgi:aspartate aminotransferase
VASFGPEFYNITVTVNGLSKAYSMTGWRLGYLAAPEPIAKAIDAVQSHSTSNPTSFAQAGGVAAINGPQDYLAVWRAEFTKRRAYMLQRLNAIPGVSCINAKGAFYLLPNIGKVGLKPLEFAERLLEEEKVAVVPGEAFGTDQHIRLSYACSMSNIEKGLDRIERFCRKRA